VEGDLVSSDRQDTDLARQARRWPRRLVGVACASWAGSLGLLWVQEWLGVLHLAGRAFVFLVVLTFVAGLAGMVWGAVLGRRRISRLGSWWGAAGMAPLLFWSCLGLHTLMVEAEGGTRQTLALRTAVLAAVSVMEAEAPFAYPRRLQTQRLVMFYDDGVTEPQRDIEAMDRFLADLEERTGRELRGRVHWVRGKLLRRGRMNLRGLALGSTASPDDWDLGHHPGRLSVDRHELAHAWMYQVQPPGTAAPTLLIEGWAESQGGPTEQTLAALALHSRQLWLQERGITEEKTPSYLRDLTGPAWYHRIGGPCYSVGGAFSAYLIRVSGIEPYLELYFASRPGRFAEVFEEVIGQDLDTVEKSFWAEMRVQARPVVAPRVILGRLATPAEQSP
jgi:hypothetical protein